MLGERIKEIRKQNKLSQTKFGEILGISKTTVSNWENNHSRPDPDQITNIAINFKIPTDYLHHIDIEPFVLIKHLMKHLGMMVDDDLTQEEFEKALQIINIIKK